MVGLLILPQLAEATCLQNCDNSSNTQLNNSSIGYQSNERRTRSHNFGNNSTAILGDVNINVGHKRIDITGMKDSQNSMIDASITSIVNVGSGGQ